MSLLEQLPRLSAYDPGAVGEGGLDPLGVAAVAERIAEIMAPGVRARMNQPRFVTLTAIGSIAYQSLWELTADEGKTTVDFAFEWLVVEAMVRHPLGAGDDGALRYGGLPGSEKGQRALRSGQRLKRATYLNGPRVFGFTGVYRPFSQDAGVLTTQGQPGVNASRLVSAWERDFDVPGYVDGVVGTPGGDLRKEIADACRKTLEKAECAAPPTGSLLNQLADLLAPREARGHERRLLRGLITAGEHDIRNELTARLDQLGTFGSMTEREIARQLLPRASVVTHRALRAAFDYEEAATAIDHAFRRLLAHATQQHASVISSKEMLEAPGLAELAPRVGGLVKQAVDSVNELGDVGLTEATASVFEWFGRRLTTAELFDALIGRHEEVQARKRKLSWVDRIDEDWTVRVPYRNQSLELSDEDWVHPMRLTTLATLLAATA